MSTTQKKLVIETLPVEDRRRAVCDILGNVEVVDYDSTLAVPYLIAARDLINALLKEVEEC